MGKLFGTDGIRGQANKYPMTVEIAQALGLSYSYTISQRTNTNKKVVIGKDTRESGDMIEAALASGLCAGGLNVIKLGIVPTPAVAYLTKLLNADAGFVITASHNPPKDNGIKLFGSDGYKLSDQIEENIESCILTKSYEKHTPDKCGYIIDKSEARQLYIDYVIKSIPQKKMKDLSIVVDCANGAASTVAYDIFNTFDLSLKVIHNHINREKPINENCGAMDTRSLQDSVIQNKADLGIAFDGDADRLVLCDHLGEPLNGDHILAICGQFLIKKNRLPNKTLVATQYSNMGLDNAIAQQNGKVVRVLNGDRYVIEKMCTENYLLGGEASGHIIFHEKSTTGDGLIAALQMLNIIQETGKPLSQLKKCISFYPQVTRNVTVKEKKDLKLLPQVINQINYVNQKLGAEGRTLIRYSGTENKARVMIEGKNKQKITEYADSIVKEIQIQIGV